MATSHTVASPDQSPLFDRQNFQRCMNKFGRAYRNQAMELISICRVFSISRAAEQIQWQDAKLSEVLQACDETLALITDEGENTSVFLGHRIELVIQKLLDYERMFHPRDPSSSDSVRNRMTIAMGKDKEEEKLGGVVSRLKSLVSKPRRTRTEDAPSRVVSFHLLTSTQPTLVRQLLTHRPNLREVLWNFFRHDSGKGKVTLTENPHFYLHCPPITSPSASPDDFPIEPMEHFLDADNVYVLTNKPGRVYLDSGEDSQAFDNFWTTNGIYISRDVCGKLDGVRRPNQGRPCEWCRAESQPEDWAPVQDWRRLILYVLDSQDKIRIRISTGAR